MTGTRLLTVEEEEAIHQTWDLAAKDLKAAGVAFFTQFLSANGFSNGVMQQERIAHKMSNFDHGNHCKAIDFFTGFPQYQKYFKGFADIPLDQLAENKRFKAHGLTVLTAIGGLVNSLDDPEVLTEMLLKTGQNHQRRKLKIEDFQNLRQSLLEFLEKALGDAWTPTADAGWKKALTFMMAQIGEGLEIPE